MAEVTVSLTGDGEVCFAVSWAEPMRMEFTSRADAERLAIWLRATGRYLDGDGTCPPCAAHHASDHACAGCGADLGLRVRPADGMRLTRPRPWKPKVLAVALEQHRLRVEAAERLRRERITELAGLAHADHMADAAVAG